MRIKKALVFPVIALIGLFLTMLTWAFASPVGSTPDEDFHLVSIWCSNGGSETNCPSLTPDGRRVVNAALVNAACYAQKPEVSAACQATDSIFKNTKLVETARGNFGGNYPAGFYATMHLLAGDDIQVSVILMRILNLSLFVALLTALWLLVPRQLHSSLYFAVCLTIVPLGLFLIPSINPSSWAITGVFATFFGCAGALQSAKKSRFWLWGISAIGLAISASSRYDALLYSLIALAAAVVVAHRFKIPRKYLMIGFGALAFATVIFIGFGGSILISKLASFAGASNANADIGPLGVFFVNVAQLPMLFAGFSGSMGLGWLDTAMPFTVWMLAAFVVWATLFSRLSFLNKRSVSTALSLMGLLIFIPMAVLQMGMGTVGENVQSRYLLPLFIALVSTVLFREKDSSHFFSGVQVLIVVSSLFLSQTLALYTNMSRYIAAGASNSGWNLNAAADSGWWWESALSPNLMFFLGTLGFGMFLMASYLFVKSPKVLPTQHSNHPAYNFQHTTQTTNSGMINL